eukprot:7106889-Pyramimonas_sp.AAC.2
MEASSRASRGASRATVQVRPDRGANCEFVWPRGGDRFAREARNDASGGSGENRPRPEQRALGSETTRARVGHRCVE